MNTFKPERPAKDKFKNNNGSESLFERFITNPISISVATFLVMLCIVMAISWNYYGPASFTENLLAEAHGVLIDILMLGVIIVWFQQKGNNKLLARRYQDEIDDFRNWKAEEAARRIRGNIKRMNEIGITAIDLSNCYLRNMDMRSYRLNQSNLWRSDLSFCDIRSSSMSGVYMEDVNLYSSVLSSSVLKKAVLFKADMRNSDLRNSSFTEALMQDARLDESDLENADLANANLSNACLASCNLTGANLKNCILENTVFDGAFMKNCDLRGAIGLTADQLSRAHTLFETRMDEKIVSELMESNDLLFINPEINAEW